MRFLSRLSAFVVVSAIALYAAVDEGQHQHAGAPPAKLGQVRFATSCAPAVRPQFTRAVALLHSFWYDEARRQFQAVAEKDPRCAMAWWGVAMTYWHPLWEPRGPQPDALKAGNEAIEKAAAAGTPSRREKDFIAALADFYRDYGARDHIDRVLAYEKAMEQVHARYPADTESAVFYALSLLGSATSLPPDKTYARQKKASALLQPIFRRQPQHPGLAHYIIHANDYPTLAVNALTAARRYAKIAADSAHAQHMPSHIFTRLGLWQESIQSNLASAATARKNHEMHEELHADDYLVFAYLQTGQDEKARQLRDEIAASPAVQPDFAELYARAAIPARYVVERRDWAAAAALPDPVGFPGGRYAWAEATTYFARALGAARTGKLDAARADIARLAAAHKTLLDNKENYWAGQVEIQRRAASAWLALAEVNPDHGLELMRAAVELEDSTDKHPVTPGAVIPARDLLGQMLIELKQPALALGAYEKLLANEPNRFGALYGAARSAQLAGEPAKATKFYARLLDICRGQEQQRAELREARDFLARGAKKEAGGQ